MRTLALTTAIVCLGGALTFAGPESLPSSGKEMKETIAPAPPACDFSWTGFYIGGKAGYGWGNSEINDVTFTGPNPFQLVTNHHDLDSDGFVGGGELGFNWQIGKFFVLGAAADFFGSGMSGDFHLVADFESAPPAVFSGSQDINWFGTVRGRVGFAPFCRLLIYGTGGFAYADVDESALIDYRPTGGAGSSFYPASRSDTDTGWTGGGGLEFAIGHHWAIKAEYLHIDVGDNRKAAPQLPMSGGYAVHYRWQTEFDTVTGGLNFKF